MKSAGNNEPKTTNIMSNVIYNKELGHEIIVGELCYDGKIFTPRVEKYSIFDNIVNTIYNRNENIWQQKISSIKNPAEFSKFIQYEFLSALAYNTQNNIESFDITNGKYKDITRYKPEQKVIEQIQYEQPQIQQNVVPSKSSMKDMLKSMVVLPPTE